MLTYQDFDQWLVEYARHLPVPVNKRTAAQKASDVTNVAKGQAGLAAGTQLGAQGTQISTGSLLPAYQQMLKGPSAAETQTVAGGLGAEAGAQRDALARRAASTGNPAAYTAGLDKLAQTQDITTSNAMAKLATSDRDEALKGLSNLYGVDTATMSKLLEPGKITSNAGGFKIGVGPFSFGADSSSG